MKRRLQMNEKTVMEAFTLFSQLNVKGSLNKDEASAFMDEGVRGIMMSFAESLDATIISAGNQIYLIPLTVHSDYHVSNQSIKDNYFPKKATNMDIYLLYVAVIVFVGEFYDSYQTTQATRDFLTLDAWMAALDDRLQSMKQMDQESLIMLEQEYEYNWTGIIKKWDDIDIIKENVKQQTARTNSRKSFMNIASKFLVEEGLAREIGFEELEITDKTKVLIQRFFMDYEYNRGILDVLYEFTTYEEFMKEKGETIDADDFKN